TAARQGCRTASSRSCGNHDRDVREGSVECVAQPLSLDGPGPALVTAGIIPRHARSVPPRSGPAMTAVFAHVTDVDLGKRSMRDRVAAERQRVYALCNEIQIAIYDGDQLAVDHLMAELACATTHEYLVSRHGKH